MIIKNNKVQLVARCFFANSKPNKPVYENYSKYWDKESTKKNS